MGVSIFGLYGVNPALVSMYSSITTPEGAAPQTDLPSGTPVKQDCHQDKTDSRLRSGLPPVRHHALLLMQFFFSLGLRQRGQALATAADPIIT